MLSSRLYNRPIMPAVQSFVTAINNEIINPIIGLIFAAALLYFIYGAAQLVFGAGDDSKRSEGKQHMLWGIVGMTIMVSVFALLVVGLNTFGVGKADLPADLPLQSRL